MTEIVPANPFLRCDLCGVPVRVFRHTGDGEGPVEKWPCGHGGDYTSICPSWGPVDGCTCPTPHRGYRAALQVLADAAGQYLYDYAESNELRRAELRRNLADAEDAARDTLMMSYMPLPGPVIDLAADALLALNRFWDDEAMDPADDSDGPVAAQWPDRRLVAAEILRALRDAGPLDETMLESVA